MTRPVRMLFKRCNITSIGRKTRNNNSIFGTPQTVESSMNTNCVGNTNRYFRLKSKSRHYSTLGCCVSLSAECNTSQISLNGPSALKATVSPFLEHEEEDIDGTWLSNLLQNTCICAIIIRAHRWRKDENSYLYLETGRKNYHVRFQFIEKVTECTWWGLCVNENYGVKFTNAHQNIRQFFWRKIDRMRKVIQSTNMKRISIADLFILNE